MIYLSVDSIGEKFATCEDDNQEKWEINIKNLPHNVKEGDVILVKDSGEILIDENQKNVRQNLANSILNRILNKNSKFD